MMWAAIAAGGVGATYRSEDDVAGFDLFPPIAEIDFPLTADAGDAFLGDRMAQHVKAAAGLVNQEVKGHHAGAHTRPAYQARDATPAIINIDAFVDVEDRAPSADLLARSITRACWIVHRAARWRAKP